MLTRISAVEWVTKQHQRDSVQNPAFVQNGAFVATTCLNAILIERFELLHKFPSHFV